MKSLALCLFLFTSKVFAWGELGHQTTAEIAERFLTPAAQTAITDILGAERLAIAAIWPDLVRDDPDFEALKPYHFITLRGTDYESLPKTERDKKDAGVVLEQYPQLLKDPKTPRSIKIAALKYLIHVIADLHQPFHVGGAEDAGGNFCQVQWTQFQATNLHSLWDDKMVDLLSQRLRTKTSPLRFYSFVSFASDIIKNQGTEGIEQAQAASYFAWIKESKEISTQLYPATPNDNRDYCKKGATNLPLITDAYKDMGLGIVEKRLFFGGLRTAAFLNEVFKDGSNPGTNESLPKKQIIEMLLLNNY